MRCWDFSYLPMLWEWWWNCPSCASWLHATQIWLHIVPSDFITNFFSFDRRDWFFNNLKRKMVGTSTYSWQTTFMTTCWYLWKWRNKTIFEVDFQRPYNPNILIQRFVRDIEDYNLEHLHRGSKVKDIIYIGWKRPHEGWIKLNSDAACKDLRHIFSCGGIFRDADGQWIKGYTKKIVACDALHAEMWGVVFGYIDGLEGTFWSSYSGKWHEDIDRHDLWQVQV